MILKEMHWFHCVLVRLNSKVSPKPQDEDVYTFFEPELPFESPPLTRLKVADHFGTSVPQLPTGRSESRVHFKKQRSLSSIERKVTNYLAGGIWRPTKHDRMIVNEGSSVLELKGDNYFSCAVSRKRSHARYLLGSSSDVVLLLKELAECLLTSPLFYTHLSVLQNKLRASLFGCVSSIGIN
ncbi:hypothetical protein Pint_10150 [Pistacia integerrima]|uniref:Uncharacterized protein n=1 Tax=Pistacia integerrima TaxID=434235 RepID=A0ACC0XLM8_9ROSI|nr:hypothetical protein Pint_10150 [Pistacia integerrima]